MADSVGVQREPRDVTAKALHEHGVAAGWHAKYADAILAALADAGISVGRYEVVGYQNRVALPARVVPPPVTDESVWEPVYRRVDGATGEQTE